MEGDPQVQLSSLHVAWSTVLSLLTAIGYFTGKRLVKDLDSKADKDHVDNTMRTLTQTVQNTETKIDKVLMMLASANHRHNT